MRLRRRRGVHRYHVNSSGFRVNGTASLRLARGDVGCGHEADGCYRRCPARADRDGPAAIARDRGSRAAQRRDPHRRRRRFGARGDRDRRREDRQRRHDRGDSAPGRRSHAGDRSRGPRGDAGADRHAPARLAAERSTRSRRRGDRQHRRRARSHSRRGGDAQARRMGARTRLGRRQARRAALSPRLRSRQGRSRQPGVADAHDRALRRRQQPGPEDRRHHEDDARSGGGHDRPRQERRRDGRDEGVGDRPDHPSRHRRWRRSRQLPLAIPSPA